MPISCLFVVFGLWRELFQLFCIMVEKYWMILKTLASVTIFIYYATEGFCSIPKQSLFYFESFMNGCEFWNIWYNRNKKFLAIGLNVCKYNLPWSLVWLNGAWAIYEVDGHLLATWPRIQRHLVVNLDGHIHQKLLMVWLVVLNYI